MGMRITTIKFEKGLPLLPEIQAAFFKQTGLHIYLSATVNVLPLTTKSSTISLLLEQGAEAVAALDAERRAFAVAHPHQYESQAKLRDDIKEKKCALNHISDIRLIIYYFYYIQFITEGKPLKSSAMLINIMVSFALKKH